MSVSLPNNPYLLLTPGPLTTSLTVKQAMLRDWCTWDDDYNALVQLIRKRLLDLATKYPGYTSVLMQGSGTFCIESVIGSSIAADGKLLVLSNGTYGHRIVQIAETLKIPVVVQDDGELQTFDMQRLQENLTNHPDITHVAMVHCETSTGMLNDIKPVSRCVKNQGKVFIVDAMSSFGGIEMDIGKLQIDFLISSANKCIQGVPGFGFILAPMAVMASCAGRARSLSLDMIAQWQQMEDGCGKWRFTSPTHVVRAFSQALTELQNEGGVALRAKRYKENQSRLVKGMALLGFDALLRQENQSPVITSFLNPVHPGYEFKRFYNSLKQRGFVIYPGKISDADTFRIGTIGDVYSNDIDRLLAVVEDSMYWTQMLTRSSQ